MKKILVVDDEENVSTTIKKYFDLPDLQAKIERILSAREPKEKRAA